jgi:hypothetical protein
VRGNPVLARIVRLWTFHSPSARAFAETERTLLSEQDSRSRLHWVPERWHAPSTRRKMDDRGRFVEEARPHRASSRMRSSPSVLTSRSVSPSLSTRSGDFARSVASGSVIGEDLLSGRDTPSFVITSADHASSSSLDETSFAERPPSRSNSPLGHPHSRGDAGFHPVSNLSTVSEVVESGEPMPRARPNTPQRSAPFLRSGPFIACRPLTAEEKLQRHRQSCPEVPIAPLAAPSEVTVPEDPPAEPHFFPTRTGEVADLIAFEDDELATAFGAKDVGLPGAALVEELRQMMTAEAVREGSGAALAEAYFLRPVSRGTSRGGTAPKSPTPLSRSKTVEDPSTGQSLLADYLWLSTQGEARSPSLLSPVPTTPGSRPPSRPRNEGSVPRGFHFSQATEASTIREVELAWERGDDVAATDILDAALPPLAIPRPVSQGRAVMEPAVAPLDTTRLVVMSKHHHHERFLASGAISTSRSRHASEGASDLFPFLNAPSPPTTTPSMPQQQQPPPPRRHRPSGPLSEERLPSQVRRTGVRPRQKKRWNDAIDQPAASPIHRRSVQHV